MSTICKIDPAVRAARYRRREVAHQAQDAAMRSTGLTQEAMVAFAHRLNAVRFSPVIRGIDSKGPLSPQPEMQCKLSKEQRFKNLFQQLRNT